MNGVSRSLLRLLYSLFYAILTVLVPALIGTDIPSLQWTGVLLGLFLLDAFWHLGKPEKTIPRAFNPQASLNIASYTAPKTLLALERATDRTALTKTSFALELLSLLARDPLIVEGLTRLDISASDFTERLHKVRATSEPEKRDLSPLMESAFIVARELGSASIEPFHVFIALARSPSPSVRRAFDFYNAGPADLQNALALARVHREKSPFWARWVSPSTQPRMNRAWTARATPFLDRFGEDFTEQVRRENFMTRFEHEAEYQRLMGILSKSSKPNALLIGDPGIGKETIVHRLAAAIINDDVPPELFDRRLVALYLSTLGDAGAMSERLQRIATEILRAGNIILYIPDIHNLFKTSGERSLSAADILLPIIHDDAFPIIGSTFPREFKEFIEPQSEFAAIFEPIRVTEMSESDAIRVLIHSSIPLEDRYKTIISFGALKTAVTIAHKHFRHKLLPASAEDLLKEALAEATQQHKSTLTADDIIAIAERKTNIPIHRPGRAETEKLLRLEEIIHQRLIDQNEAVTAVARALREYRSGLARQGGPIASFLFVGPTGVGKTELAKTLAAIQFGSETMMIRFDMSEYQDKQSFFRFIGSPDGRIAGMLTESVIQKPYCLILLDEFEKSHPDIFNLFLQVLDDGRLTDNLGRTIDFSNTILIATSNAHSDFIKTHIDAHTPIETIADELKKKLTDVFRPELLNRFSDIIVFKTLSPEDLKAIAQLQLNELIKSLDEAQGVELRYDDAVLARIAELGFDPSFGARPLRAVIGDQLRSPLAERLLKGDIVHGDIVTVNLENNGFQFRIKK